MRVIPYSAFTIVSHARCGVMSTPCQPPKIARIISPVGSQHFECSSHTPHHLSSCCLHREAPVCEVCLRWQSPTIKPTNKTTRPREPIRYGALLHFVCWQTITCQDPRQCFVLVSTVRDILQKGKSPPCQQFLLRMTFWFSMRQKYFARDR